VRLTQASATESRTKTDFTSSYFEHTFTSIFTRIIVGCLHLWPFEFDVLVGNAFFDSNLLVRDILTVSSDCNNEYSTHSIDLVPGIKSIQQRDSVTTTMIHTAHGLPDTRTATAAAGRDSCSGVGPVDRHV